MEKGYWCGQKGSAREAPGLPVALARPRLPEEGPLARHRLTRGQLGTAGKVDLGGSGPFRWPFSQDFKSQALDLGRHPLRTKPLTPGNTHHVMMSHPSSLRPASLSDKQQPCQAQHQSGLCGEQSREGRSLSHEVIFQWEGRQTE